MDMPFKYGHVLKTVPFFERKLPQFMATVLRILINNKNNMDSFCSKTAKHLF
jgi:hypothetical protein